MTGSSHAWDSASNRVHPQDQILIMNQFSPDVSPSSSWEAVGRKLSSLLGDNTPPGPGPPGPARGPATSQPV